ncbi:unnamed protein product [Ectocarpus sp. 6 AP-2014]
MASATRKLYLVAMMICATSLRCVAFSATSSCSSIRVADPHIMSNSPTTPRTGRGRCGSSMEMKGRKEDEQKRRIRSSSSGSVNRGDFVRAAAAAALTLTVAGHRTTSPARAVGVQPGERTTAPPNALLLVPALRAKLAVQSVLKLMKDPEKWGEAREALKSPPLAPADFKECFRTYSDADPEQHLAFDLYRIQAQDALKAVSELLAYLASEKNKGSKIDREDVKDLEEAGRSVLQGIDDFLALAPREDVLMVAKNTADQARTAQTARPKSTGAPPALGGGRELEGAVIGEGAFVAGAWVGK